MKRDGAAPAASANSAARRLQLPDSVSSAQDLQALILEIRQYAKWLAHESIKQQVAASTPSPSDQPPLTPAANTTINAWTRKPVDPQLLDQLIAALEDFKEGAASLTIVLAAPPTGGIKKTLVAWCRQNIAPDVLVSFEFNATILGGMVVRNGSRIYDWSFRRQILEHRAGILEFLRSSR